MTPNSILKSFSDDATADELKGFIRDLNEDEQASLVALAWIGRGSFGPEELDEALSTARSERANRTEDYLLGMPLLPDYLEEALDRLGYSVEDAEDDVALRLPAKPGEHLGGMTSGIRDGIEHSLDLPVLHRKGEALEIDLAAGGEARQGERAGEAAFRIAQDRKWKRKPGHQLALIIGGLTAQTEQPDAES